MKIWPIRFREVESGRYLYANDTGSAFFAGEDFLERYVLDKLTPSDTAFLLENGLGFREEGDFYHTSGLQRIAMRQSHSEQISYLILVPTLRCNLACSYCQVSRAHETADGFDWSEDTLKDVLAFLDRLETKNLKIEFQGGEPLMRVDLLEKVRAFCKDRFAAVSFVVCTNLQKLGPRELRFLDQPDVTISTSLDGDLPTHERNRTGSPGLTRGFAANLRLVIERYGVEKVSALATIDYSRPVDVDRVIQSYRDFGLTSFFFRPVHYHGFARKAHAYSRENFDGWKAVYLRFIDRLIELNWQGEEHFEEFYFSTCLRRALRCGTDGHVDLRNPNLYASDYLVIDYDGILYPTDEARMLARTGQIDLSIGTVSAGLVYRKVDALNFLSFNTLHEDCVHCAYQPICGIDLIDDIARYGRADVPKYGTWFCRQQTMIFDQVYRYLCSADPKVQRSVARWAAVAAWPHQGFVPSYDSASAEI